MTTARTIRQLIRSSAERHADAPALLAPGRPPLPYGALERQRARLAGRLRAAGVGPRQRVAVVLPNGPEMAAAFLAVASCSACAPLNPAYTRQDFGFYLSDLNASLLLVEQATPPAAAEAAAALGIRVLPIRKLARAGEFDLDVADEAHEADDPGPDHAALLLHTSGTTARPKLVPLSAANLTASAAHVAATLALAPADRCLNIMPLFHIHGVVAALLASLSSGASVVCTDGVYANSFFAWMSEFQPTWYSAVPSMHQGILARASEHDSVIRATPLRFIRSSSAALPPVVLEALEQTFHAPVVEAYGMTEAAHQMTCNPLPPAARKPGSVGPAAGPEVAIMDAAGALLESGATGEVVIRGPNVTAGYLANPEANRTAFTNGWFRTGDQGRLDQNGYLHLTGRLKELINRGGEKISPREIDEVLLAHPAVRQALAFAVPHAQLGEEVAAAVELRPGESASAAELRRWTAEHLANFKVPRIIRIVESVPKGPTGKLQRIGLARVLGIEPIDDTVLGEFVAPRTPREERVAAIWRELLPGARAGVQDRWEALGGDSLLAVSMLAAVSAAESVDVPFHEFVEEGTIAALCAGMESRPAAPAGAIVALRSGGSRRPLFCLPGHDATLLGVARLAAALDPDQPAFAIDWNHLEPSSGVTELSAQCLAHLRRAQPAGPYRLAGVCFGGVVAYELAHQLVEQGETVEFLALIDCLNPAWRADASPAARAGALARQLRVKVAYHSASLLRMGAAEALRYVAQRAAAFVRNHSEQTAARLSLSRRHDILRRGVMHAFRPLPCTVDALLVPVPGRQAGAPLLGWQHTILGRLEAAEVPFHPLGSLAGDNAGRVAAILESKLRLR